MLREAITAREKFGRLRANEYPSAARSLAFGISGLPNLCLPIFLRFLVIFAWPLFCFVVLPSLHSVEARMLYVLHLLHLYHSSTLWIIGFPVRSKFHSSYSPSGSPYPTILQLNQLQTPSYSNASTACTISLCNLPSFPRPIVYPWPLAIQSTLGSSFFWLFGLLAIC